MKKILFTTLFLCSTSSLFSSEEGKMSPLFPRRLSVPLAQSTEKTPLVYYQKIVPLLQEKKDPNPGSPNITRRAIFDLCGGLQYETPLVDEQSKETLRNLGFIDKQGQPSDRIKCICAMPPDFMLPHAQNRPT